MKTRGKDSKTGPVRVIVIEDDEDDIALLLRQLNKANIGTLVRFIKDGQEALDFIEENAETLVNSLMVIFLDLKLPSVSGLQVLRKIKSLDSLNSIPVVIMTSSNNPKDVEECRLLKAANYVEKPITFSSFSKAMADVFDVQESPHRESIEN